MSNERLIKKYFKFLKQYGFKRKALFKNGDSVITYSKSDFVIEISYELSIQSSDIPQLKSSDIDELSNESVYIVSVNIRNKYRRANIFYFDLFNEANRKKLKSDINEVEKNNLEQILKIYSQFLMNEISKLNIF